MLLNTEELLALINGDVEPDRLADLLDRLEHCPESAAALQVLVTLRANREEALEALRTAAETEPFHPTDLPHPAARQMAMSGWALQGLRMAASIAIVAMIGIWALSSPIPAFLAEQSISATALADNDLEDQLLTSRDGLGPFELTGEPAESAAARAIDLIERRNYVAAIETLQMDRREDPEAGLLLGLSHYALGDYDAAWQALRELQVESIDGHTLRVKGLWLEANTLLALDRPFEALLRLEELQARRSSAYLQPQAAAKYVEVAELLGLTVGPSEGR